MKSPAIPSSETQMTVDEQAIPSLAMRHVSDVGLLGPE